MNPEILDLIDQLDKICSRHAEYCRLYEPECYLLVTLERKIEKLEKQLSDYDVDGKIIGHFDKDHMLMLDGKI